MSNSTSSTDSVKHAPGPGNVLPLWKLAKPWTAEQWHDIVTVAQLARICRKQAAQYHGLRRESIKCGIGAPSLILDDARNYEWKARRHESWLHRMAEVRGSDLDDAAIAKVTGEQS